MSILLTKVLWYKLTDRGSTEAVGDNQYADPINITDILNMNAAKGLDIKNNIVSLNLKNAHSAYVDTYNEIMFQEQDQIKVFVKYTDSGVEAESATWSSSDVTEPSSSDMIAVFYVIEFAVQEGTNSTLISLKCADKTYVLFNRVLAKAFTITTNSTAPQVVQTVARFASQNPFGRYNGTGTNAGVKYDIDARLVSEGGFIEDTRRTVKENGTTNSDLAFPAIAISKVWKPIYEWISDLSQVKRTNTSAEMAATLVYGRPFIFWVDEDNHFHWVYPTDIVADRIEVGKFSGEALSYDSTQTNDAEVLAVNMNKKVFDVTNMIIYNAGSDMFGTGIFGYEVDTTSNVRTLKMRMVPMIDIAEKLKNDDYDPSVGIAAASREGTPAGKPLYQFPTALPPAKNAFCSNSESFSTAASLTTKANYNTSLRESATFSASARAKNLLSGLAHARWTGTITIKGRICSVGNLVEFTDTRLGIYKEKLRIIDIRYNISKDSFTTELTLEKDAVALTGVSPG